MPTASCLRRIVVGVDGSSGADVALDWSRRVVGVDGTLHVVHVVVDDEPVPEHDDDVLVVRAPTVVTGIAHLAEQVGADAVVVGHHPRPRFGPRVVGHVTARLLDESPRPVIVVPEHAPPSDDAPIVVGVGVADPTRAALRWGMVMARDTGRGLSLVHALAARSMFRPDGLLDLVAWYLDSSVLTSWREEDVAELAAEVRDETDGPAGYEIDVRHDRVGHRLVEAGEGAGILVIGRHDPVFDVEQAMAAYLHHALTHAPCPVALIPASWIA
jgi:nucleotide-binding universal stress UspA family protein